MALQPTKTKAAATLMAAVLLWEGSGQLTVYADKLAGGLPTVCGGNTNAVNGKPLVLGQKFTKEQCEEVDLSNILLYSSAVKMCITKPMSDDTLGAFTLMAINIGTHGFCKQSRTSKLYNMGLREEACKAIATSKDGSPAWSTAGGKYVQGLQNRRKYERDWCLRGLTPSPVLPLQPTVPVEKSWWQQFIDWIRS
jgi:GH24 family phage-related lysozyme (muramidase)